MISFILRNRGRLQRYSNLNMHNAQQNKFQFVFREFGVSALISDLILSAPSVYFQSEGVFLCEQLVAEGYITNKEKNIKAELGLKLCQNKQKTKEIIDKSAAIIRESEDLFPKLESLNLTEKSDQEVYHLFSEYFLKLGEIFAIYFLTEPHCFEKVEDKIKAAIRIKADNTAKTNEYFSALMTSKADKNILVRRKLKLTPEITILIEAASTLGVMRLELGYYWRQSALNLFGKFIGEIGQRKNLSPDQVSALRLLELKNLLLNDKTVPIATLNKRVNRFVIFYTNGRLDFYTDKKARELISKIRPKIEAKTIQELTGSVANPGVRKGRVRVIKNIEKDLDSQLEKMQKGEILVTEMTRPQIILAVKKASAIITDEGGISCHAAILARELNKPCIIGTKIATEVLRDGDEVEVNADEGVVRIIQRNQSN